jgi:hypothetical protein
VLRTGAVVSIWRGGKERSVLSSPVESLSRLCIARARNETTRDSEFSKRGLRLWEEKHQGYGRVWAGEVWGTYADANADTSERSDATTRTAGGLFLRMACNAG